VSSGEALLWVPVAPVSGRIRVLGLPLARRIALGARRAGFSRVLFEDEPSESLGDILAGTGAELVPAGSPPPDPIAVRTVVLPPGLLPQAAWLRARSRGVEPPETGVFPLRTAEDVPRAERWLLASLVKDEEGFMSRHVERRISLAISRRLAGTRVTPNAMTLVSVGVGLAGAAFFLSARPAMQFAGAVLFLLHSILDGCDGELARLNFQESRLGGILDFWGDNVVHAAVFGCIAAGRYLATGELWPVGAGLAAVAGTLASATFVFRKTMSAPKEGPQFTSVSAVEPSRFSRAADALARRDFIYLVVVLAAFGRAHWFLALAAVGAPLFFLVLVALDAAGAYQRRRSLS
jgi:phosphatidylglycerophosphate synthase